MCAYGGAGLNVKVMGVVQPSLPNKLVPAAQKCFVLAYNQGYANLSTPHYLAVKNTANKGACCSLCQRDPRCVAWTRVAGDSPHDSLYYLHMTKFTVAALVPHLWQAAKAGRHAASCTVLLHLCAAAAEMQNQKQLRCTSRRSRAHQGDVKFAGVSCIYYAALCDHALSCIPLGPAAAQVQKEISGSKVL